MTFFHHEAEQQYPGYQKKKKKKKCGHARLCDSLAWEEDFSPRFLWFLVFFTYETYLYFLLFLSGCCLFLAIQELSSVLSESRKDTALGRTDFISHSLRLLQKKESDKEEKGWKQTSVFLVFIRSGLRRILCPLESRPWG